MDRTLEAVDLLIAGLDSRTRPNQSTREATNDPCIQLVNTATAALRALQPDSSYRVASCRVADVLERRRLTASRNLRRAIAANITELDTAVMNDLMRVVKRLSKGATPVEDNGLDRIKLTLELMEMAVKGAPSRHPEHLIWLFNELYKGLGWVTGQEEQRKRKLKGG